MRKRTLSFLLILVLLLSGIYIPTTVFAENETYEPYNAANPNHVAYAASLNGATTNPSGLPVNMYYVRTAAILVYGDPDSIQSGNGMTQQYSGGKYRIMGYNYKGIPLPNPAFPNDVTSAVKFSDKNWIVNPWIPSVAAQFTPNDNTKFSITKATKATQADKFYVGPTFQDSWLVQNDDGHAKLRVYSSSNGYRDDPITLSAAELDERLAILSAPAQFNAGVAVLDRA